MIIKYKIKETDKIKSIKDILCNELYVSNRLYRKLKQNNCIYINNMENAVIPGKTDIKVGDNILVNLDYPEDTSNIIPVEDILNVLYEDEFILAVDKPPFMPVHPSMDHFTDSLSNIVRYYFDKNHIYKKTRPINRLDKNTSGIVLFAKNEYAQELLIKEMSAGNFSKKYIAYVYDNNLSDSGEICLPIGRKANSIIERTTKKSELMPGYKMEHAITKYTVLKRYNIANNKIAKVECELLTRKNTSN